MPRCIDMMSYCLVSNLTTSPNNIAWISGMPRSGTTWLSQVFAASPDVRLKLCPLFSYEFKNALDENSTSEEWDNLYYKLYRTNSDFLNQEHLRQKGLVPSFIKNLNPRSLLIKSNRFHNLTSSILKHNENVRLVYIVRNPCASLHSWLSDPDEFPKWAEPLNEWRTGHCRKVGAGEFWGFDDWVAVTKNAMLLSEVFPTRCRILRYEDLVNCPESEISALCDFFKIDYVSQIKAFLKLSHSRHDVHKHSVFKDPNLLNEWQNSLDPLIVSTCKEELKGTKLEFLLG